MIILNSNGFTSEAIRLETKKHINKNIKRAVIITTASPDYKKFDKHIPQLTKELQDFGLSVSYFDFDTDNYADLLDYDLIMINGGNPYYLLNSIEKNECIKIFREILNNEKIIVGLCAGGSILCNSIELMNIFISEKNDKIGLSDLTGLGLVDISFVPHYERNFTRNSNAEVEIRYYEKKNNTKYYRINDGDAIFIKNNEKYIVYSNNELEFIEKELIKKPVKEIISIPIDVRSSYNKDGMYVIPVIIDYFSKLYGINGNLILNFMDSFNKDKIQFKDEYIQNLNKLGTNLNLSYDYDYRSEVNNVIIELISNGYAYPKTIEIIKCDCGRVDYPKEAELSGTKILGIKNHGSYFCQICFSDCFEIKEERLVLKLNPVDSLDFNVFPANRHSSIMNILEGLIGKEMVISKNRNTGFEFVFENKTYSIDVDYYNYFLLASIIADQKIVISSNHTEFQQSVTYLISNMINKSKDYTIVSIPYLLRNNISERQFITNENFSNLPKNEHLKYLILKSLRNAKQSTYQWDDGYYDIIKEKEFDVLNQEFSNFLSENKKVFNHTECRNDMLKLMLHLEQYRKLK